ncbi:hypothetical protein DAPPUDRAFT_304147 [Daphnia pulex]|uniref:CUB domain-containing protein n=1 Tax=Daphnia pulex TaxID=6669 RepID=E9GJJ7_DAPPU|nr:hypothetical protein DAPPUDRAFT_304147 [Daphnia pulex]|eukprot:EFX80474.1 hypothetical protein DAPPUDRAFT_304147 [Daphnia pulex]
MRQLFLVLFFDLCVVVYFTSAGILDSFFLGLHSASEGTTSTSNSPPPSESTGNSQTAIAKYTGKWHTNSSSFYVPTDDGGQLRIDLCEGDIVVPLTFDGKDQVTVKSTKFPYKRSTPLICSWNVQVTKNCWRGMVTMKIDGYSRLADLGGCRHGYYTVSPFMNDTKICGRINTVPDFQWYVENQQPENVTITLRHAGLDDGFAEGLGFTLSGECLPNASNMTLEKANESYSSWLQQLSTKQSEGGPTVYIPSENDSSDSIDNSTAPTTLSPTSEISVTTVAASHQDLGTTAVQPPLLQSNISSIDSLAESHPHNGTVSANLSTESNNVTEIPSTTTTSPSSTIPTTTTTGSPSDPVALPGSSSLLNNSSVVGSLTAENPTTSSTQPTSSFNPTTKRPSSAYISNGDPDIPWLILKAPAEEFLPEYHQPSPVAVDSPLVRPNVPVSVQSPKPSNNPINPSFAELFVDIDIPDRIRDPADTRPLTIHTSKPYPKRKQQLPPAKVQVPPRNRRPNLPGNNPEPPTITDHRQPLLSNKKEPSNGVANLAENNSEVILIDVVLKSPSNKPENTSNDISAMISEPGKMTSNNSSHSPIKLPPATTIKASSSNRPNFYKPPLRNPLLTFED